MYILIMCKSDFMYKIDKNYQLIEFINLKLHLNSQHQSMSFIREATKKKVKKFHKCELWGGGVSKFWCVNRKKVLFLELIFQKKHAVINS